MSNRQQRKQRLAQEQERRELEAKKGKISRRTFLGLAGLAAAVGVIYGVHEVVRAPTYAEAMLNPSKRQAYAESLLENKPTYADVHYMPQGLLAKLRGEGYEIPFGIFAVTIPHERDPFRIGTKSTIILTNECFDTIYQQAKPAWHDIGLIVGNVINNHEMLHAKHFHNGIHQYENKLFYNTKGEFNRALFKAVSELLAHQEEGKELERVVHQETAGMITNHLRNMPQMMLPYFRELFNPEVVSGMDPMFVKRLRQDLVPQPPR